MCIPFGYFFVLFACTYHLLFNFRIINGQEYVLTGSVDPRFLNQYQQNQHNYLNHQENFRHTAPGFQPINSYFQPRDLQTSDLPFHLQQTLPQYKLENRNKSPQTTHYTFQAIGTPEVRTSHHHNQYPEFTQNVSPSTHRPNYPHLFAQNRSPQTETFLGEITIQNSDNDDIYKSIDMATHQHRLRQENIKNQRKTAIDLRNNNNNNAHGENIFGLRTQIFAPDSNEKATKPQIKNYFVNKNGDVTATKTGADKTHLNNRMRKKNTSENHLVPQNSLNLESLLEEPLKEQNSSDNDVEVIKSIGAAITKTSSSLDSKRYNNIQKQSTDSSKEIYDDYDYDVPSSISTSSLSDEEDNHQNNTHNDIQSDEYVDNDYSDESSTILHVGGSNNKTYEIITEKPAMMVRDDNFSKFVDSTGIDTTTEESITTTKASVEKMLKPVVSVVTTKSVVNNTIIASDGTSPAHSSEATEKMPIVDETNTTDSWVIVASVQTSRSISGARYLPSSIFAQNQRVKLLNERNYDDEFEETTESLTKEEEEEEETKEDKKEGREKKLNEEEENVDETTEEIVTTIDPTTTIRAKTSTESLIDKLDRVQSDLSSGLLTGGFKNEGNNIAVINENMTDKMDVTTMLDVSSTTPQTSHPSVMIKKFSSLSRPSTTPRYLSIKARLQNNKKASNASSKDVTSLLSPDYKVKESTDKNSRLVADIINKLKHSNKILNKTNATIKDENYENVSSILENVKEVDISAFLPPGYSLNKTEVLSSSNTSLIKPINNSLKDTLSTGMKKNNSASQIKSLESILKVAKPVNISSFLPPDYKQKLSKPPSKSNKTLENIINSSKEDDISAFLPPGYKEQKNNFTEIVDDKGSNSKEDNVNRFVPAGHKTKIPNTTVKNKKIEDLFSNSKEDDVASFLPPGYKLKSTTRKPTTKVDIENVPTSLLPPGYKLRTSDNAKTSKNENSKSTTSATTTTTIESSTKSAKEESGLKVVFPSRPGGGTRKPINRLTTPKSTFGDDVPSSHNVAPTIHKGWPSRATTEFTGWPTPSTTPISIEKLLEAARMASTSTTSEEAVVTFTVPTSTTTTSTTTQRPTTPGVCNGECDLVGTIKLVGGAKWSPELLDRNTKEWQVLANEVQSQLEELYSRSEYLNKWYNKIRIDGFSQGSILVDYVVELNDLGKQINTLEVKKLFHQSLIESLTRSGQREAKSLNDSLTKLDEDKLKLGDFVVDPTFTDFVVIPKQLIPTVGYAEDNILLPQWAIAVIVIGLASLLFVIIFGVTVLINRQKNSKKKIPVTLTEDMLNELNKNHMGGFENYGAEDLYNMEDVWNDRGYDTKLPPKKRSAGGSIHDSSMANLYDSWKSEWNGYYYNAYYGGSGGGGHPGSSNYSGYGRRRSDYDTNF